MTLFLTAHRRDHRLAAPLTASLVGARWTRDAAFREGRRRHHHDQQSVLPGGPCRRVQYLCCAYASPPDGVSSRARLCGDHGKTLLSSRDTSGAAYCGDAAVCVLALALQSAFD